MTATDKYLAKKSTQKIPTTARTRSGVQFFPNEIKWYFRDGTTLVSINFDSLPSMSQPLITGLKKTLIWHLEHKSPSTVNARYSDFLQLAKQLAISNPNPIDKITPEDILAFRMTNDSKVDLLLCRIRSFLIKLSELKIAGIPTETASLLNKLKLKKNPSGVAVATLDPEKAPLTDLEFEAIQTALNNAYARAEISADDLLACYLFMSLGTRPVQLASLKCRDLIAPNDSDGDYILKVPRAKQRNQLQRSEFKIRKLTKQIGHPLSLYINTIRKKFSSLLVDTLEAPIFPEKNEKCAHSNGFEYHPTAHAISTRIIKVFASLNVPSERLAGPIPMCAIRFRRTFATRAAEEGWPLLVLAELMDHSNTRTVEVYTGLTARVRATFSRKIAFEMAPLAMAFAGKVIHNETEASRPGTASRIVDLRIDRSGAGVGSCGSHAHCAFARPFACYAGCHAFEPWLDAPHEATLDYMLARREHLVATTDIRIAAINDRAILGCAQVILRCRQILEAENNV
jgi:integrase